MSLFASSSKLSARTLRLAQQHSVSLRTSTPTSTSHLAFTRNFHPSPANMTVTKITTKEDYYKLIESTRPGAAAAGGDKPKSLVIIDAFATWCGPCKMIAPEVEKLSEKYGDKAHFIQIDVDDLSEVAQELGIRAMPTFKVFKDGEPFDSLIGAHPGKLNDLVVKAVATVA